MITPKPEAAADSAHFAARVLNLVLDADQRIVFWNSWLTPRCGRAAGRVMVHSLFDVFPTLRGSRIEAAVLAALADDTATAIPQSEYRSPFPLRAAGSFDGPLIEQAVSVSSFREDGAPFCLVEIRDISGANARERRLLDHAESLRARSYVDGLTGIANRRYFDVALDRELRRAQRLDGTLSLLLTDIDSFKAYNDHFGHQAGDTCLSAVAQALATRLKRPADVAALNLPHAPGAARPWVTLRIGGARLDPVPALADHHRQRHRAHRSPSSPPARGRLVRPGCGPPMV